MADIRILQLLQQRSAWLQLHRYLPTDALERSTTKLLDAYDAYFKQYPKHDKIRWNTFNHLFHVALHPKMPKKERLIYRMIIRNIRRETIPEEETALMRDSMLRIRLEQKLATYIAKHAAGEDIDLVAETQRAMDQFKLDSSGTKAEWIDDQFDTLLADSQDDVGVQWGLECLRSSMRAMRSGDFGILAARPNRGKTSLLASQGSHFSLQLSDTQRISWFNNESDARRIWLRVLTAATGKNVRELYELCQRKGRRYLDRLYERAIGGPRDKIRIYEAQGWGINQIRACVERDAPSIVIADMLDNVSGDRDEGRHDLNIEAKYQKFRELMVECSAAGIATSQISADGEGQLHPTMDMLKDSKTGKQGACDWVLMMGASNAPELRTQRVINLPKNKLRRLGGPGDPRSYVTIDEATGRFEDSELVEVPDGDEDGNVPE